MAVGFNGHKVITASVASGAEVSTIVEYPGYNHVSIGCATFANLGTSTANVGVQVSNSKDGTFRTLKTLGQYSGGAGILDWEVPSTTGGWIATCQPAAHFNALKVTLSTAATGGFDFEVHLHN